MAYKALHGLGLPASSSLARTALQAHGLSVQYLALKMLTSATGHSHMLLLLLSRSDHSALVFLLIHLSPAFTFRFKPFLTFLGRIPLL